MATKVNVVTPSNLGKTLKKGLSEAGKYDVNTADSDFLVSQEGEITVNPDIFEKGWLKNAVLSGSTLVLERVDGTMYEVPLSSLVPAAKADQFLKKVEYNSTTQKLVFTVGNDLNTDTTKLEVSVADLLPVVTGVGLQGNGTSSNPVRIKAKAGNTNKAKVTNDGIEVTPDVEVVDSNGVRLFYAFS